MQVESGKKRHLEGEDRQDERIACVICEQV